MSKEKIDYEKENRALAIDTIIGLIFSEARRRNRADPMKEVYSIQQTIELRLSKIKVIVENQS